MIEVSVSGRAEGLVASSAINFFSVKEGTITGILSDKLRENPMIDLPFQVLTIYIEAVPHNASASSEDDRVKVEEVRKLAKFHTGQTQKIFELTISNRNFYSLSLDQKKRGLVAAFKQISAMISKSFPDDNGRFLADLIARCGDEFLDASAKITGDTKL